MEFALWVALGLGWGVAFAVLGGFGVPLPRVLVLLLYWFGWLLVWVVG